MRIEKNKPLTRFNTFGFEQKADLYTEASTINEVQEVVEYCKHERLALTVIGDGSNVVLVNDIPGMTLRMTSSDIHFETTGQSGSDNNMRVSANAGVNWHHFVRTCIDSGAYGLENLSLIPGTVGAAPIQNIGAYGVELAASLELVECVDCETNEPVYFSKADCQFSYRDSLFKQSAQILQTSRTTRHSSNKQSTVGLPAHIITRVDFVLPTIFEPNLSYAALRSVVEKRNLNDISALEISDLVCEIRQSKLPDPATLGNAGSFFKNPIVDMKKKDQLCDRWNKVPVYPQDNGEFKLAAGWLVEQAGFKGTTNRSGKIGSHQDQALVLVNHGGGSGRELLEFADEIQQSVQEKFGVVLEQEPGVLPRQNRLPAKAAIASVSQ